MSNTRFDREDIKKRVPQKVIERTKENMETCNMSLSDAFKEAAREFAKKGTKLWWAWYYNDFREFIPVVYEAEYLDFSKYPLAYERE